MAKKPQLRGANFKGKWSLGSWAEQHIIRAISATNEFRAVPYGKSEVGPSDMKAVQQYWTKYKTLEEYGKRPDILVFDRKTYDQLVSDSPHMKDCLQNHSERDIKDIVTLALLGIESEASIWEGKKMSHYGRDWSHKIGKNKPVSELKSWTAPTIIVKDEDLQSLKEWRSVYHKPICVVHLFYDMAFMLNFDKLLKYIEYGTVKPEEQPYGQVKKTIYKTFYGLATDFGQFKKLAEIETFLSQTKGGKFEADLYFKGGTLKMSRSTIEEWLKLKI